MGSESAESGAKCQPHEESRYVPGLCISVMTGAQGRMDAQAAPPFANRHPLPLAAWQGASDVPRRNGLVPGEPSEGGDSIPHGQSI